MWRRNGWGEGSWWRSCWATSTRPLLVATENTTYAFGFGQSVSVSQSVHLVHRIVVQSIYRRMALKPLTGLHCPLRVLHCAYESLSYSVVLVRMRHKVCTGNAALDTALPVFSYVFSRSGTVIKFSSLSYKGLKLTDNDQSLTMLCIMII